MAKIRKHAAKIKNHASKIKKHVKRFHSTARVKIKKQFYLNMHDEDKVLLFASGILFGVGATVSILTQKLVYGGLVAITLALVMILIEKRNELNR